MKTYKAKGKLLYYPSWWLILKTDDEICRYYKHLITLKNRRLKLNTPMHGAHVTVIYGDIETPVNKEHWNKYQNEEIEFEYNPFIIHDREYYWIKVECPRIEQIRVELGLKEHHCLPTPWHITVANEK